VALLSSVSRFLDKYIIGYALGTAAGPALEPYVQDLANAGWTANPVRPLPPEILAEIDAHGLSPAFDARSWAHRTGTGDEAYDALVESLKTAPDMATLLELRRREFIDEGAFTRGLHKARLEDRFIAAIRRLVVRLLSPAELANARQQEFIDDARLHEEGAQWGYSPERMDLLYKMAGLPPGPMDGLTLLRRGFITEDEYRQLVAEGHTKTKYTDAILALRERIISAPEAAGLRLRGWLTRAQAEEIGALNGFDAAQMELLYLNRGRPATVRQVHIGYARGGSLPQAANEREAVEKAVAQSNIRTEYTDLLWAQRYTYPSAFVIRGLAQRGTFDRDTTERILVESGWPPSYATLAADDWTAPTSAGPATKWADRARTRVFTEAWNDFIDGNSDEGALRALLAAVGAPAGEQDTIVALAETTRDLQRRDLTQAQILKLYKRNVWPLERAQAALEDLGMTAEDAADLLEGV